MLRLVGRTVIFTKGDTVNLNLNIFSMGVKMGEILYDVINPQVILTVKEDINDKMPAIEKRASVVNGKGITFSISAKESSLLKVRTYKYDVQLLVEDKYTHDTQVYTIIPPSNMIIECEVGVNG